MYLKPQTSCLPSGGLCPGTPGLAFIRTTPHKPPGRHLSLFPTALPQPKEALRAR